MGVQRKIDNKQEEFIKITIWTTALQSIIIFCNAAVAAAASVAAVLNSQFAIWNVKAAADADAACLVQWRSRSRCNRLYSL